MERQEETKRKTEDILHSFISQIFIEHLLCVRGRFEEIWTAFVAGKHLLRLSRTLQKYEVRSSENGVPGSSWG